MLDPHDYIHRVGRTARGANGSGKALLVLLPNEKHFVGYMKKANIKDIKEYEFNKDKLINIQEKFEKIISANLALQNMAKDAYKAYIFVRKN